MLACYTRPFTQDNLCFEVLHVYNFLGGLDGGGYEVGGQ